MSSTPSSVVMSIRSLPPSVHGSGRRPARRRVVRSPGDHLVLRSPFRKGISMAKVSMLARLVVHDGKGDELIAAFEDLFRQVDEEPGTEGSARNRRTSA